MQAVIVFTTSVSSSKRARPVVRSSDGFRRLGDQAPFDQDVANLFFQLFSSRCEHASMILTSNLSFAKALGRRLRGPDHRLGDDRPDRAPRRRHQRQGNSYRLPKYQAAAGTAQ